MPGVSGSQQSHVPLAQGQWGRRSKRILKQALRGPKRMNRRGRGEAAEIIFGKEQSRFLARRFFALSAVKIIILETLREKA
jgi:hypothetical protein